MSSEDPGPEVWCGRHVKAGATNVAFFFGVTGREVKARGVLKVCAGEPPSQPGPEPITSRRHTLQSRALQTCTIVCLRHQPGVATEINVNFN